MPALIGTLPPEPNLYDQPEPALMCHLTVPFLPSPFMVPRSRIHSKESGTSGADAPPEGKVMVKINVMVESEMELMRGRGYGRHRLTHTHTQTRRSVRAHTLTPCVCPAPSKFNNMSLHGERKHTRSTQETPARVLGQVLEVF